MFYFKLHKKGSDTVLGICDQELMGKELNGKVKIRVSEGFYGTETCNKERLSNLLKKATIVNAIGNDIVSFLLEQKEIDEESVLEIENVKHAQIVKI